MALIAHLATITSVLSISDGFVHLTRSKIEMLTAMKCLTGRHGSGEEILSAPHPEQPIQRGTAQNPDIFFRPAKPATRITWPPDIVQEVMDEADGSGTALPSV